MAPLPNRRLAMERGPLAKGPRTVLRFKSR